MSHAPKNVRRAKRLGIVLSDDVKPTASKSYGVPPLTFGKGRITRFVYGPTAEGRYVVKLRSSQVGEFRTLGEAVQFAKWLGRKANRQAARGVPPKAELALRKAEKLAESENREEHVEGMALLKAELARVNSGAVKVS